MRVLFVLLLVGVNSFGQKNHIDLCGCLEKANQYSTEEAAREGLGDEVIDGCMELLKNATEEQMMECLGSYATADAAIADDEFMGLCGCYNTIRIYGSVSEARDYEGGEIIDSCMVLLKNATEEELVECGGGFDSRQIEGVVLDISKTKPCILKFKTKEGDVIDCYWMLYDPVEGKRFESFEKIKDHFTGKTCYVILHEMEMYNPGTNSNDRIQLLERIDLEPLLDMSPNEDAY